MLGLKQWPISRFYLKYSLLVQKILECSQLVFSLKIQQEFIFYCKGVLWKRSCGIDFSKLKYIPYNFILNPKFSAKLSQFSLLSCSFVSYPRAICSFSILSYNLSLEARPNELETLSIDNSFVLDMLWRSDISYLWNLDKYCMFKSCCGLCLVR